MTAPHEPLQRRPAPFRKNTVDDVGTVRIVVFLGSAHPGGFRVRKGNIIRSFSVRNARVSAIAELVEKMLYG